MVSLKELRAVLETVCHNVSYIESIAEDFPRIIYSAVGWESERVDMGSYYGHYIVTVDLYSREPEFEPLFDELINLFVGRGIVFAVDFIEHGTLQDKKKAYEGVSWYRFIVEVTQ